MSDVFLGLQAAVPFVRTLGLEEVEVSDDRAVLRLPDVEAQRNHVGGPHAGAMFSLGESASGAVVLQHFGRRWLGRHRSLWAPRSATSSWRWDP